MDRQDRLVSEIMRCEVATLAPDEKLDLADDIMCLGRVRHMPVTEDSTLVGIVSARDLLAASLSQILEFDWPQRRTFLRSVTVNEAMTAEPVTVQPETTLRAAAKLMLERKIGCLPVVKPDGSLLGLVTETDMLAAAFLVDDE
jgi:CBS domain-containing protein